MDTFFLECRGMVVIHVQSDSSSIIFINSTQNNNIIIVKNENNDDELPQTVNPKK